MVNIMQLFRSLHDLLQQIKTDLLDIRGVLASVQRTDAGQIAVRFAAAPAVAVNSWGAGSLTVTNQLTSPLFTAPTIGYDRSVPNIFGNFTADYVSRLT